MIQSFRHKGLRRSYETGSLAGIQPKHADRLRMLLAALDTAQAVGDMDVPGFRLHPLKGELKGLWSVTVRANWRIVFRFEGEDAFDVELIDYH